MAKAEAVVGASDHYARAELVTLGVEDGTPRLLDRRRVALIDDGLPIAPYHHEALEMEIEAASRLIDEVSRSVERRTRSAISALTAAVPAGTLILPASPFEVLPGSLDEVLGSRALTLAADGMLYRESLARAAADLGMEVLRYPRDADPARLAARTMGLATVEVAGLIAQFGRQAGAPWRRDHKRAAAAALSVLGSRARR